MKKALCLLAALAISFAASIAQAATVNFDSGSAQVKKAPVVKYKKHQNKKVWVPAHRANGRLVKGHYIWRK